MASKYRLGLVINFAKILLESPEFNPKKPKKLKNNGKKIVNNNKTPTITNDI